MNDWKFSTDRESTVEDSVVAWAENHGWIARPMSYRGRRGCRDYDFYRAGRIVMMEFKKPTGGELSGNQVRERQRLAEAGITIHVVNTVCDGINLLKGQME